MAGSKRARALGRVHVAAVALRAQGCAPLLIRVGGARALWAWRLGPWRGMGSRLGRGGGKGRSQGLSASWARGKRRTSWAEGGVLGWVRRRRKVFPFLD